MTAANKSDRRGQSKFKKHTNVEEMKIEIEGKFDLKKCVFFKASC